MTGKTVLIAHRGIDARFPENTLPALEGAYRLGMGVEFDVHMSADGEVVVIHDETVDRTTDGSGRDDHMTVAQLKQLDAGSWMSPEFTGTRIPTLREALQMASDASTVSPSILLHVMNLTPGIISKICEALSDHGMLERTVGIGLIGQSVDVRRRFYEGSPDFQCTATAETAPSLPLQLGDPYSNWVYARFVPTAAEVEAVHAAGRKIVVSGDAVSNDVNRAREAVEAGPDAVLTWHPVTLGEMIED